MAGTEPRIWWTRKAVLLHCIIVVVVPTFAGLFWWQVQRVRQGNELSWAYVFEWPFFTGYAVYLWWKLVHDQDEPATSPSGAPGTAPSGAPGTAPAATRAAGPGADAAKTTGGAATATTPAAAPTGATTDPARDAAPALDAGATSTGRQDEDEDEELAAYNRYLAQLNSAARPKRW